MSLHNTNPETVAGKEKARVDSDRASVQVLRSAPLESIDLAVADDYETGNDPYNSTGRHVIIKPSSDCT